MTEQSLPEQSCTARKGEQPDIEGAEDWTEVLREIDAQRVDRIERTPEGYRTASYGETVDADNAVVYVHTDHNPDEVRSFYEIPDALARLVQPTGDRRTFAQALADLVRGSS